MSRGLSKRRRFDVLKRDEFSCQYCGAHPPSVVLEVDHIDPVSLGGTDDIDNLITACFDCNRGKAASPLTAVPATLAEKAALALEMEEQLRGYQAILRDRRERIERDAWVVAEDLCPGAEAGYPRDNLNGIKHFVEKLGLDDVLWASSVARAKHPYAPGRAFRYFCGICWNRVRGEMPE